MELIESYDDIEKNVRRFSEGLKSSQDLQNRLSTFVVWYYLPTEDSVGPSKFVGYRGMTAEKYVQYSAMPGEMDGGRTEEWLGEKQWFRELVEGTREYLHVKRKVDELVQKFGKSAKMSGRYRAPIDWIMSTDSMHVRRSSLNTILYGPPGTGKTYATAHRCIEICDGYADQSDESVRRRYRDLVDAGRVEFITFHQSYGYEDFVEGLRPETGPTGRTECRGGAPPETGVGLQLIVKDGVLKRVAERTRSPAVKQAAMDIEERSFFKMGLGNPQEDDERDYVSRTCIENS